MNGDAISGGYIPYAGASGWRLTLKNVFFPIFCKRCGRRLLTEENGYFCPTCWDLSPRVKRPFCSACGRPHRGAIGFGTESNFLCAECRERKRAPFGVIRAPALYDDTVADAVKLLKFFDKPRLARPLGAMMAEWAALELDCDRYDFLVPVPLHKVRLRERGFNQSELLAREILPAFPQAAVDTSLVRLRPTRVQSLAESPQQRRSNVKGAFAVRGDHLKDKVVLLIDDVITTGETISECALALKRAGAARVDVLAAALAR